MANAEQAKKFVLDCMDVDEVAFMRGSPGVGKSAIVRAIAEERNLLVRDIRLSQSDPTDLNGFPRITEEGKATYAPMDTFPLETDDFPTKADGSAYDGWLLFLDEFTSAPPSVQAAAYKVLHEKEVGMYKLHPSCAIVCAGNKESDNAVVYQQSTAIQSRVIHFELNTDPKKWDEWAVSAGVHHTVRDYVKYKPQMLNNFDPEHTDDTFACERTWEKVSKFMHLWGGQIPASKVTLLSGTIGKGVANEFFQFTKIYKDLPTLGQIAADPKGTRVPKEPGTLYAITGTIAAHVTVKEISPVVEYVSRFPLEFQVICLQEVIQKDASMTADPAMKAWIKTNMKRLF